MNNITQSIFFIMAALKIVSQCSCASCTLRVFDNLCLALIKNLLRVTLFNGLNEKKFGVGPVLNLKIKINNNNKQKEVQAYV
jgi:hypothetical protein